MQNHNRGITLVEVIVAITIALLIIMSLAPALWHLGISQLKQLGYTKRQNEIGRAVTTIQQDLLRTNQFLREPLIHPRDTNSPVPREGWRFTGNSSSSRTLILSMTASTLPVQSSNRQPVFVARSNADCAAHIKEPLPYNLIYFIEGNNLYRRTLIATPEDMVLCENPFQKQTNASGAGTGKKDLLVLKNVSSFAIDYHKENRENPESDAYAPFSVAASQLHTPLPYKQITITIGLQPSEELKMRNNNIIINESLL